MKFSESIMNYLKWAGAITVLLNFFLLGHGYYLDQRAKAWVETVKGTYVEDTWSKDGEEGFFLVHWDQGPPPPSCPVTINGYFTNNGYSVSDLGITLSTADHHTVHLSKNGKISLEPVGHEAFWFVGDKGGEWLYHLEFTFHCSAISRTQWLFWLNQDHTYTADPVVINLGE